MALSQRTVQLIRGALGMQEAVDEIVAAIDATPQVEDSSITLVKLSSDMYLESSFVATFDQSVGAKTVGVRKIGKLVTIEIPTGLTPNGGISVIASGIDVPQAFRPAADLSFPVFVLTNANKVAGRLVVSASGRLTFSVGAAGGMFTETAGFDRAAITYTLA